MRALVTGVAELRFECGPFLPFGLRLGHFDEIGTVVEADAIGIETQGNEEQNSSGI